jgi:hypothetical protein
LVVVVAVAVADNVTRVVHLEVVVVPVAVVVEAHKTTTPREEAEEAPVEVREVRVTTVQALINLVVVVVE